CADDVFPLLQDPNWHIRVQGISVLPTVMDEETYRSYLPFLEEMVDRKDSLLAPYVGFLASTIGAYDEGAAQRLLLRLARNFPNDRYVADAILTNLQDREAAFK